MRILLRLKPLSEYVQNFEYHHAIQGFIYSLLANTSFEKLHDKKGYKFFSFSNIFAARLQGDLYNMIIASPLTDFIEQIAYQLRKMIDYHIPVEIGGRFELLDVVVIKSKNLTFPLQLVTGSPILIRIPQEKFKRQSDDSTPKGSIFWRSSHPIEVIHRRNRGELEKEILRLFMF